MNHIVKIQSWTGLLRKDMIFLSIFYHFVVIFNQKVNLGLFLNETTLLDPSLVLPSHGIKIRSILALLLVKTEFHQLNNDTKTSQTS